MSFIDCANLPDHVEQECNNFPKGGFPAIAIVDKEHTISDWTNATQWQTNISSGNVRLIKRVKGDLPQPSENQVDNPVGCGSEQINDGFNWTFHWTDANVNTANNSFYEQLNVKEAYLVFYNCTQQTIEVVTYNVTFVAKPMGPASSKEYRYYEVVASWSTAANAFPTIYTAPTGIFA